MSFTRSDFDELRSFKTHFNIDIKLYDVSLNFPKGINKVFIYLSIVSIHTHMPAHRNEPLQFEVQLGIYLQSHEFNTCSSGTNQLHQQNNNTTVQQHKALTRSGSESAILDDDRSSRYIQEWQRNINQAGGRLYKVY